MIRPANVDSYIAGFPPQTQQLLEQMRAIIRKAAPEATEGIGYGMPAYRLGIALVYFAGYQRHIGFYPSGSGIAAFQQELAGYKHSKGAVQFPLDQPLPEELIATIVRFRADENRQKAALKKKK
jgi:uncharacterized protein YdhG (YjbR/CyaY superfamily)